VKSKESLKLKRKRYRQKKKQLAKLCKYMSSDFTSDVYSDEACDVNHHAFQ